jgi:SOS regulatory protein LexA
MNKSKTKHMTNAKNHFNKIISFWEKYKRMPSYAEILKETGMRTKNTAFKLVNKLVEANLLKKDAKGRLLPTSAFNEIKVLGVVEAGIPSIAEEQLETITLDNFLIKNRNDTYMLEVTGDSMIDAGTMPGDFVVVERSKVAKVGDIVIAQVDGLWTMKYMQKKRNRVYLQPANKKYKPIFAKQELYIIAVVQAVIRKYK